MISTSFISGGGLKKCIPHQRSGLSSPAAIAVTDSDEVFVAKTPPARSRLELAEERRA